MGAASVWLMSKPKSKEADGLGDGAGRDSGEADAAEPVSVWAASR